jgi:hypothetical protein
VTLTPAPLRPYILVPERPTFATGGYVPREGRVLVHRDHVVPAGVARQLREATARGRAFACGALVVVNLPPMPDPTGPRRLR